MSKGQTAAVALFATFILLLGVIFSWTTIIPVLQGFHQTDPTQDIANFAIELWAAVIVVAIGAAYFAYSNLVRT